MLWAGVWGAERDDIGKFVTANIQIKFSVGFHKKILRYNL